MNMIKGFNSQYKFLSINLKAVCTHKLIKEVGYKDLLSSYTNIVYLEYRLFGITFFRRVIFKEDVPSFAIHQRASLGYTDWKSSKPWLIDAANKRTVIYN